MEALKIFPEYNYKIQNEKGKIYVQFKSRVRKFVDGKWYLMDIKDTYYLFEDDVDGEIKLYLCDIFDVNDFKEKGDVE